MEVNFFVKEKRNPICTLDLNVNELNLICTVGRIKLEKKEYQIRLGDYTESFVYVEKNQYSNLPSSLNKIDITVREISKNGVYDL